MPYPISRLLTLTLLIGLLLGGANELLAQASGFRGPASLDARSDRAGSQSAGSGDTGKRDTTDSKKNARQSRRELLRDESDLGLGMSVRRHRDYEPADDLDQRRKAVGLSPPPAWQLWQAMYLDLTGYHDSRGAYCSPDAGSRFAPIYQWQAPVVGDYQGRPFIIPGTFQPNTFQPYTFQPGALQR
ncbi:hypothetical protein N9N28_05750 [Rubripirellula amarantea]|nr:hypothetical protein [Rubripirellula amarantea]